MVDNSKPIRRLFRSLNGNMVNDAETAIELAEVLIRRRFGGESLKAQQPLSARDAREHWAIEGTPNASEVSSGVGPIRVEIKKADAGITALYFDLPSASQERLRKDKP